jgi:hypothetical protein
MARRGRVRMRERESISVRAGVVLNIVSRRVFVGWLRGDGEVRGGEEQAEEEEEEEEEERHASTIGQNEGTHLFQNTKSV